MKTQVISLFGGPGCGKSTLAADLFVELKRRKKSVELVREWVKEWAWEGKKIGPLDQPFIFANQLRLETMLYGKVDYVITDSPLVLQVVYERKYNNGSSIIFPSLQELFSRSAKEVDRHNFVLRRFKEYDQRGRYETEEDARNLDAAMVGILNELRMPFIHLDDPDEFKKLTVLRHLRIGYEEGRSQILDALTADAQNLKLEY